MAMEVAEAAGGSTGGGTLKSPDMTTFGFSLNETERKRIEVRFGGFEPEDSFRLLFGGFPADFGGVVGGKAASFSDDDIFHFRGRVEERYEKCIFFVQRNEFFFTHKKHKTKQTVALFLFQLPHRNDHNLSFQQRMTNGGIKFPAIVYTLGTKKRHNTLKTRRTHFQCLSAIE